MSKVGRLNDPIPLPGRRGAHPPVTPAQRALYHLDVLHPGTALYTMPFVVGLTGRLDRDALAVALDRVVARHEPLRTSFGMHEDGVYQRVSPPGAVPLPLVDLTDLPADERERRRVRLLEQWSQEPFDLANGPVLRARLIRLTADEHVLGMYLHHIACDGLSIRLLFDELGEAYGGGDDRPSPRLQFADYAAWLHRRAIAATRIDWWQTYLEDTPGSLAFPAARPRMSPRSISGGVHEFTLSRRTVEGAIGLARTLRTTPVAVLLSAYAVMLGHAAGERNVLVGMPASSRPFPELERLIGLFVNMVPVRADLSGDPTFGDLVLRVRRSLLAALDHEVPFDTLVEELRVRRSDHRSALVQATFGFDPAPLAEPRFGGLTARLLPFAALPAKFDLDLMIARAADGSGEYTAALSYATDLFTSDEAARLAESFTRVLAGAEDPSARPSALLPREHPRDATGAPHRVRPARPTDTPVHELFGRQAHATPDAPAVRYGEVTVTYAELDERSHMIARRLRAEGVRPGETVGILLPRGAGVVPAMLGILKAGAAYHALDPRTSMAHTADLLIRSGGRVILTDARTAERGTGPGTTPLDVDAIGIDSGDVPAAPSPRGLAYVVSTSGSTGTPKCVAVEHRALVNHAQAMRTILGLSASDRVLQFAHPSFDVAAEEIFPTLLAGACVVVSPDPPAPADATSLLRRGQVTVANLPSGYWQRWAASLDPAAGFPLPVLRLVVIGSERVDAAAVASWSRWTGVPMLNAYGLSETTITTLVHRVEAGFDAPVVPAGTPIDGARAHVLDPALRPVPAGAEGELHVGGIGVARGYAGLPGRTADRFVPDPFAAEPGARLYRTGARARSRADGAIEILGRLDDQLKVNGYRVEPRQVETCLEAHPAVARAAVAVLEGADGTPRLAGYVVRRDSGTEVPADLRAHLNGRLPFHLVPASLMTLLDLPVTAGGKVDRTALPKPSRPAAPVRAAPAPASASWEHRLRQIWTDVLETPEISVEDNFFDAGGSSYALATVHRRIGEMYGLGVPLVLLYEYPTVAALARRLADVEEEEHS